MYNSLDLLDKINLKGILREISGKFNVPLTLLDREGGVLCSTAGDGSGKRQAGDTRDGQGSFPIRLMNDVVATLSVDDSRQGQGDRSMATAAAYCLESTLRLEAEIADLSGEIIRVYDELSLMYSLTNKLGSEMDVDTICRRVLEETEKILEVQNLSIMLLDNGSGKLRTRDCRGRDADAARDFTADMSSGFIGQVMRQGTPVTICDIMASEVISFPYPARSILCVPLVTDDRAIGLLLATDKLSLQEFWSRELKLMGMFAMEIAASIMKAQLYQDIKTMFINTVEAFASAIDAKDPYTYGHSRRVALVSMAICEELGMAKKQTGKVELAALLHDIGKIGTPESILHKPGKLQPEEFEKMKEHPGKGAEILSGIREFSEIITWIKHHHEWYDGRGYPDGIATEAIPIEARIITIADAYDAMTSDRPYRKGMPLHDVINIMEESSRNQFDPDILGVFRRLVHTGKLTAIEGAAEFPDATTRGAAPE